MGWESHHSRSTHTRHLGQHSANLSPATPMCLLSSPDSDLFLSAQGAGFNRPYTLNNYNLRTTETGRFGHYSAHLLDPALQTAFIAVCNPRLRLLVLYFL